MENFKKSNGIMKLWVARDQDGYLYLYDKKPIREEDCFNSNPKSEYSVLLHSSYFPEVTFENSPQEVELKLVNVSDSFDQMFESRN